MKTLYKTTIASLVTLLFASLGFGQLTTISDLSTSTQFPPIYIGGDTTGLGVWDNVDVIANPVSGFEIEGFAVSESGGSLTIDIYATEYFQRVINGSNLLNTEMGDLFISVDGLAGQASDTTNDYFGSGDGYEDWEYAIGLGDHLATSGNGILYQLDPTANIDGLYGQQILTSDETYGPDGGNFGGIYRTKQEVQINTQAEYLSTVAGASSWSILPNVDDTGRDVLSITLDNFINNLGLGGLPPTADVLLGFHWTMTCANDVIEFDYSTSVPVPEPSTVGLLAAAGMVGALFLRRRLKK